MASKITNLHQAFHRLAARRTVEDPWGNGIKFNIKRPSSAWQQKRNEMRAKVPFFLKVMERHGMKLAGEKVDEFHLSPEELRGVDAEVSARELAEAIADELLEDWSGLFADSGEPVKFSREEAVSFLTSDDYAIPVGLPVPAEKVAETEARWDALRLRLEGKESLSADEQKYVTSFYRDGDQLMERVPYGGTTMGAALRHFLVQEAEKLDGFYQKSVEGLRGN